jgi:hypothetical protein
LEHADFSPVSDDPMSHVHPFQGKSSRETIDFPTSKLETIDVPHVFIGFSGFDFPTNPLTFLQIPCAAVGGRPPKWRGGSSWARRRRRCPRCCEEGTGPQLLGSGIGEDLLGG